MVILKAPEINNLNNERLEVLLKNLFKKDLKTLNIAEQKLIEKLLTVN